MSEARARRPPTLDWEPGGLLHRDRLVISCLVLALGAACREAPSPRPRVSTPAECVEAKPPGPVFPAREEELARLVNATRREHGLPPLELATRLAGAARLHARDMAVDGYLQHDSYARTGSGLRRECGWTERVATTAPGYSALGETLAAGTIGPSEVVEGWMRSPVHRRTLLGAGYEALGVGCWQASTGETYWVADFGGGERSSTAPHPDGD